MEHDFENIHRGARSVSTGKTRITIYLDDDVLQHFRAAATTKGRGYQTEINAALRNVMDHSSVAKFSGMNIFSITSGFRSTNGSDFNHFYLASQDKKYHECVAPVVTRRTKAALRFNFYQMKPKELFKQGREA